MMKNDSLLDENRANKLLARGGFPPSYLAKHDDISYQWRQDYISTFLERDIPNLGFRVPAATMRRFWIMLSHYHGQTFNASELGKSLGVAHTTARNYLDILTGTFMIRELSPWFENIKNHPRLGAVWESFAMEQIIHTYQIPSEQCFYWAIHEQAELDLFLMINGKRIGFEFKYKDAPTKTSSMMQAIQTLALDQLYVIYPGKRQYHLAENILVTGLEDFFKQL